MPYPRTLVAGPCRKGRGLPDCIFQKEESKKEAIEKANNTPFGLSAGIWGEKGSRTLWAAQQLRAGVIWTNSFNKFDPTSPFGGYKESGWGREGGRHGLAAYLKGVSNE